MRAPTALVVVGKGKTMSTKIAQAAQKLRLAIRHRLTAWDCEAEAEKLLGGEVNACSDAVESILVGLSNPDDVESIPDNEILQAFEAEENT